MILLRSLQQETAASEFNVIRVSPDGKNIHRKGWASALFI
jgi:hypothetical protein